ncbi:MAG: hypothetical protein ACTHJ5_19170 [Ilyomonas sp.]
MSLKVNGDVLLGDDDKSIREISRNGFIDYRIKNQTLNIKSDDKGSITYTVNGVKKTDLNTEDKALLEQCVETLIDYGIDAADRVRRTFAKNGSAGVLNEVNRFKSDFVKEMYLSWLLKNQNLSKDEMITLLNKADQYLGSDYYKSELLNGVMTSFLSDEATSEAYLRTVTNIKSDYYQYTTINNLLKTSLNEKQFDEVLAIVDQMKSDYYQSEVLKNLLNNAAISNNNFPKVMNMAANMKSDYYKSEIISALLQNKDIGNDRYSQTIAAMQSIKSDYYQSEILKKLIDENIKDESEWSKLIAYAGNIKSDSYQSEVLIRIADKMPDSESLKNELTNAAKKIRSDYYYGRVKRVLDK